MFYSASSRLPVFCSLLIAAILLFPTGTMAGSQKAKVKGNVQEVAVQVEEAFEELEIDQADSAVTAAYAMTVGKAKSGARVTVSVNGSGDDECEITVTSDSPTDPELEKRFLMLMQSR
jgi:hypothetical protein